MVKLGLSRDNLLYGYVQVLTSASKIIPNLVGESPWTHSIKIAGLKGRACLAFPLGS